MNRGFYHPQQRTRFVASDVLKVEFIGSVEDYDIFHMMNPTPITYVKGIHGGQWNYIWNAQKWQDDWDIRLRRSVPKPPPTSEENVQTILNMVRCFAVALPDKFREVTSI